MSFRKLCDFLLFIVMSVLFLSGIGQGIQEKLQGILSKINRERLRNRVTDWQKKLVASASSKFSFDSTAAEVLEASSGVVGEVEPVGGSSSYRENPGHDRVSEEDPPWDELTESEPGKRPDSLREGIMEGEIGVEKKLLTPVTEEPPRNKSPVQLWVDSLIDEHERRDEDMPPIAEADQNDAEVESFTLGAEAPGVVCPRPYPFVQVTAHCSGSDAGSHCSSMESLLEARKPDPEEMLLELGFGGCEEPDIISRIPDRFLRPSSMKGVAIDDFIKHQQMMVHQFQSGFSGYRGLTGPTMMFLSYRGTPISRHALGDRWEDHGSFARGGSRASESGGLLPSAAAGAHHERSCTALSSKSDPGRI
uniref:Sperm-specific antigen 2 n=1 Tax=Lygus hesperus TaxID=30085 RepID=A0A0A9WSL6_LYGHE